MSSATSLTTGLIDSLFGMVFYVGYNLITRSDNYPLHLLTLRLFIFWVVGCEPWFSFDSFEALKNYLRKLLAVYFNGFQVGNAMVPVCCCWITHSENYLLELIQFNSIQIYLYSAFNKGALSICSTGEEHNRRRLYHLWHFSYSRNK